MVPPREIQLTHQGLWIENPEIHLCPPRFTEDVLSWEKQSIGARSLREERKFYWYQQTPEKQSPKFEVLIIESSSFLEDGKQKLQQDKLLLKAVVQWVSILWWAKLYAAKLLVIHLQKFQFVDKSHDSVDFSGREQNDCTFTEQNDCS